MSPEMTRYIDNITFFHGTKIVPLGFKGSLGFRVLINPITRECVSALRVRITTAKFDNKNRLFYYYPPPAFFSALNVIVLESYNVVTPSTFY